MSTPRAGTTTPGRLSSTDRPPLSGSPIRYVLALRSAAPADAEVVVEFSLEVPREPHAEQGIRLRLLPTDEAFEARVSELLSYPSTGVQLRVRVILEGIIRRALSDLLPRARDALRRKES